MGKGNLNNSDQKFPVKIGILGGGQLARMLATACYELGAIPHIYAAKATDCAAQVVSHVVFSDGSDDRLRTFIAEVDVIIIENEFIDLDQLERCIGAKPMVPSIQVLRVVQSKLEQKNALLEHNIASLDFAEVSTREGLQSALRRWPRGIVLKTARFGYDGKGTFIFPKGVDAQEFFEVHPEFKGYAEPLARFKRELAVIVARSASGEVISFPVVESNQTGGICRWVKVPAAINAATAKRAEAIAKKVIVKMQGVGVFGVELFQLVTGEIVVNEIAPRVHNTGHFTMNTSVVSQFEQHIRCAIGLPLQEARSVYLGAAMVNILGGDAAVDLKAEAVTAYKLRMLAKVLKSSRENFWIHWYGKTGSGVGRKLGHINAAAKTAKRALEIAQKVRASLDI